MLQQIRNFLQIILQQLRLASFSRTEQATQQVIFERNTDAFHSISTMKKIPMAPALVRERITEPHPALMLRRNPAQRYRNLDIMLEELRRDRLNNMDTQLIPEALCKSAQYLQYILEQEGQ